MANAFRIAAMSNEGSVEIGTPGDDLIWGSTQDDLLRGYNGDDYIFGDNGNDVLTGGSGNDFLDGWNGADLLRGGNGNDVLLGWEGRDTLFGGQGNDQLAGENGDDMLYGNAGRDTFWFDDACETTDADKVMDFQDGKDLIGVSYGADVDAILNSAVTTEDGLMLTLDGDSTVLLWHFNGALSSADFTM
ncbi:calcium-binding protein [Paracoccus suum]|uniref:Calcium-binding protein n=1 Tax=Paracoccus suum TaxID=2259340 RepID=A0A344PL72_9RHOB|nr:calcium-binding protein [Paracoccus suum]AXC50127.1 calcium-binding protein [Paracoccus suum]